MPMLLGLPFPEVLKLAFGKIERRETRKYRRPTTVPPCLGRVREGLAVLVS